MSKYVVASEHYDSADPTSAERLGGFSYRFLDILAALGRISRYTVSSFKIKSDDWDEVQLHKLVVRPGEKFLRRDPRTPAKVVLVEEPPSSKMRTFLAWVKDGKLTVVRADGSFSKTTGMVLRSGDRDFEMKTVLNSITEVRNMVGDYGSYSMAVLGHSVRVRRMGAIWLPVVDMLPEQFASEDVVDLFTQGADPTGAKIEKRAAGTFGRPWRFFAGRKDRPLRVKIIPGNARNDGIGVLSGELAREAFENYNLPLFRPGQRAEVIKGTDSKLVVNGRVAGDMEIINAHRMRDVDEIMELVRPDGLIDGQAKCQLIIDHNLRDADLLLPANGIKRELAPGADGAGWTGLGIEPQSVKEAYEDQQTAGHQVFIISIPDVVKRVEDDGEKAFQKLESGEMFANIVDTATDEFDSKFTDGTQFNRSLRWTAATVASYSGTEEERGLALSPFDSRWVVEKLSDQWPHSMKWTDLLNSDAYRRQTNLRKNGKLDAGQKSLIKSWNDTLRVPIRCAKRIQVISEAAAKMHSGVKIVLKDGKCIRKKKIHVTRGTMRPVTFSSGRVTVHMMVANNYDWEHIIIPSHGGCDADDFFVVRWVTINGERKIVVTRNPNTRGEYTIWDYVENDWFPTYVTAKGKEVIFPDITRKLWPKQILDAQADGSVFIKPLPSNDPAWVDPEDPEREANIEDDRQAVTDEIERIMDIIKGEKLPVDVMVARRLGDDDIPITGDGLIGQSKMAMKKVIEESYRKKVLSFIRTLKEPRYLRELGNTNLFVPAAKVLRDSRHSMAAAGKRGEDPYLRQDSMLLSWLFGYEEGLERHRAVMALWHACWVKTTAKGKITDRDIFASAVFHYVECPDHGILSHVVDTCPVPKCGKATNHIWPLLSALEYFGVSREPSWSDLRANPVKYLGMHGGQTVWDITCIRCGKNGKVSANILKSFQDHGRLCEDCVPLAKAEAEEAEKDALRRRAEGQARAEEAAKQ